TLPWRRSADRAAAVVVHLSFTLPPAAIWCGPKLSLTKEQKANIEHHRNKKEENHERSNPGLAVLPVDGRVRDRPRAVGGGDLIPQVWIAAAPLWTWGVARARLAGRDSDGQHEHGR